MKEFCVNFHDQKNPLKILVSQKVLTVVNQEQSLLRSVGNF